MTNKKTVDLSKQKKALKTSAASTVKKRTKRPDKKVINNKMVQAEGIDEIYGEDEADNSLHMINKARVSNINTGVIKQIVFSLIFLVIGGALYGLYSNKEEDSLNVDRREPSKEWYAVKLVSGEVYYGQVSDLSADPVVVDKVYYDYDQSKSIEEKDNKEKSEASNLRLVKRGKETHGPEGSMNIIRSQIKYIEALKPESKVLKAIIDYEGN